MSSSSKKQLQDLNCKRGSSGLMILKLHLEDVCGRLEGGFFKRSAESLSIPSSFCKSYFGVCVIFQIFNAPKRGPRGLSEETQDRWAWILSADGKFSIKSA